MGKRPPKKGKVTPKTLPAETEEERLSRKYPVGDFQPKKPFAARRASEKGGREGFFSLLAGHLYAGSGTEQGLVLLGCWLLLLLGNSSSLHIAPGLPLLPLPLHTRRFWQQGMAVAVAALPQSTAVAVRLGSSAGVAVLYTSVPLIAVPVY